MSQRKINMDNIFTQMKDNPIVQKKGKTYIKIDKITIKQITHDIHEVTYFYKDEPMYSERVIGCNFAYGDTLTLSEMKTKIRISLTTD